MNQCFYECTPKICQRKCEKSFENGSNEVLEAQEREGPLNIQDQKMAGLGSSRTVLSSSRTVQGQQNRRLGLILRRPSVFTLFTVGLASLTSTLYHQPQLQPLTRPITHQPRQLPGCGGTGEPAPQLTSKLNLAEAELCALLSSSFSQSFLVSFFNFGLQLIIRSARSAAGSFSQLSPVIC